MNWGRVIGFVLLISFLQAASTNVQKFKLLEKEILARMAEYRVPGCAVAVVTPQKVLYTQTFGRKRATLPDKVTQHTRFSLASATKPITSTLFAILESKGLVNGNDKLRDYFPYAPKGITLAHVLSGTSGYLSWKEHILLEDDTSRDDVLKHTFLTKPHCKPGKCFNYSNAIYNASVMYMEKKLGKSFAELLREHLTEPLNMREFGIGLERLKSARDHARAHGIDSKGRHRVVPFTDEFEPYPGAGGGHASLSDMTKFLQWVLQNLDKPHIKDMMVIRADTDSSLRNFLKYDLANLKGHYGKGWRIVTYGKDKPRKLVFHYGWFHGAHPGILFDPERKIGIVVLQNSHHKLSGKVVRKFYDLFLR